MRCALLQLCSGTDAAANAERVAKMLSEVEADLIITPEMTPLLQKDRAALRAAVRSETETLAPYCDMAAGLGVHFLLGSAAVLKEDGGIANRSVLIGPDGAIIARYDKINLFEAALPNGETYREADSYAAGDEAISAQIDDWKIGLSVCYDLRFPALYANYALGGAQIMTAPSAFTHSTGKAHWETLLRARAIETGAWVLAPAQGGLHEDGRRTWGRTMAITPWGEVAGRLDHDQPGVLEVTITPSAVENARKRIPAWRQRQSAPISPA